MDKNVRLEKHGQKLRAKRTQTVLNVFKQTYMENQNSEKTKAGWRRKLLKLLTYQLCMYKDVLVYLHSSTHGPICHLEKLSSAITIF
jgi:hypothetical protein